jgi:type II secretory pathway pseudopilin PulG
MAEEFEVGAPLPEESSNRTFVIAVIVMGGLLVVSIICLVVYAFVLAPRQQEQQPTRVAEINLENTQQAASQTAAVVELTPSRTPTATATDEPTTTPTSTQVVVLPTDTPTPFLTLPTVAPETATAAAQATLAAAQGGGGATPTATALPATGFADEIGVPMLAILAGVMLAVIIIARSLRTRVAT